jgi:hypothetical protein
MRWLIKRICGRDPNRDEISHKAQMRNMVYASQSVWYALTIIIFLGCTLLGFSTAYLIIRLLINLNVK